MKASVCLRLLFVPLFSAAGATADEEEPKPDEEIVVTGSRVRRKDLNTPAPVTVISRDQISATGRVFLGEFLQTLPEQGNSGHNAQVNNGNDGSTYVSLRSLGAQRTLVLVNGRRMVPGGTGGDPSPDLGSIPAAVVERVEVLKDGASAIYGSDAIAGVVNVILRKRYSGTEVGAYGGISQRGDGATYDVHALTGTAGDRASILFSMAYQEQRPVFSGDREFSKTTYYWNFSGKPGVTDQNDPDFDKGNGCFADPSTDLCVPKAQSGMGNSGTSPQGRFTIPASACLDSNAVATHPALASVCAMTRNRGGPIMPDAAAAASTPDTARYVPYDFVLYNTNPTNYMVTPSQRVQVFSTGDLSLGREVRAFSELSYVTRWSSQTLAPMPVVSNAVPGAPVTISKDSMYNPFGVDITSWRIRTNQFGERFWRQNVDTFRIVAGLDGSFGEWAGPAHGWVWDVSYNHGRTTASQRNTGQMRMPNIAAAAGPSMVINGVPTCLGVAGDPTTAIPRCVPIDLLHGQAGLTPDMAPFVSYDGIASGHDQQDIWSANLTGPLFRLASPRPAGLAVGADYRRESASFTNEPIEASKEASDNNVESTSGGYSVREAYGELVVPILGGLPFAEELEVQGAIRWNDFSTFGTKSTYKAGIRYSPIRDVTARATYGTAYRAPNVAELYGGAFHYNAGFNPDPCNNPTDPVVRQRCIDNGVPGGNSHDPSIVFPATYAAASNLAPESSTTFTAGAVIEPRVLRGLSLVVDYYNTNVTRAIDFLDPGNNSFLFRQCYFAPVADPAICALIVRDANGTIALINNKRANAASFHTTGIDFAARYSVGFENIGRLGLIVDGTWLNSFRRTDPIGNVVNGAGNFDPILGVLPHLKFNAAVTASVGPIAAGVNARYIGSFKTCNDGGNGSCSEDDSQQYVVRHYLAVDAFVTWTLRDWAAGTTAATFGVQNIADVQPPYIPYIVAGAVNSDPSTYDFIGRFVYLRLTHTF